MGKRNYLPRDNPSVRARVQELISEPQFGRMSAAALGATVHDEMQDKLPKGMGDLIDAVAPDLAPTSLKGCVTIAEEELSRVLLRVGGTRDMSGFRAVAVRDGDKTHYVRASQLTL